MNQTTKSFFPEKNDFQVIRMHQLKAITGLSKTTLYDLIKKGEIPKPIKLGARAVGWLQSDIEAFISSRVVASRA